MTHLVIGLDELGPFEIRPPQPHPFSELHQWRAAACGQQALLCGGGAVDLLSQALVNLPNLKTIDIRDFNSHTRFRDATPGKEVPAWRSFGSSRYPLWPRQSPWLLSLHSPTHFKFPDKVLMVVLMAMGRSSTAVQNLEVMLRNRRVCVSDDAFSIFGPPGTRLSDSVRGLTKLHLDLCPGGSSVPRFHRVIPEDAPHFDWFDPYTAYLRHFLSLTTNLTWLRLNFQQDLSVSAKQRSKLLGWLALRPDFNAPAEAPWDDTNPAPVTLPLQRLDLGNLTSTPAALCRLFNKFADLENISMREIQMRDSADASDSNQHGEDDNGDCVWARFLRKLRGASPKLKQVELRDLSQVVSNEINNIVFQTQNNPMQAFRSTNTRIVDTTTLERLADNTWTGSRWHNTVHHGESADEDSMDEDSMDENSMDEGSIYPDIDDEQ